MVKKQVQYGNSAALVIEPIMETLKITNKTTFKLSADDKNLIISLQIENNQKRTIVHSLGIK